MNDAEILEKIRRINVYKSGERRAPHKPLLMLLAIGELQKGQRELPFAELEQPLRALLKQYAPPVRRHQPELPYWYLVNDGLWELQGVQALERQTGGFPRIGALRTTSGHLPHEVYHALAANEKLLADAVNLLLEQHFPESLRDDILDAVGIDLPRPAEISERAPPYDERRRRDPGFREKVLRAYEHQCAITGFRAALGGSYFGCEAAHVQWHAYSGPDSVNNGLALEPTLHKLFDAGAWSLTDDRRVIVSADYTGSPAAVERLRQFHGRPIHAPLNRADELERDYIRGIVSRTWGACSGSLR